MSLTTLKRKTDGCYHVSGGKHGKGYINQISSGRPAFSLNDSRRVEAQTGKTSIQTRMRGTGFRGHGGHLGTFPIRPVFSNYKNDYDPFNKARRGMPVIVPECPVVQQVNPLSYEVKYQEEDAKLIQKELCNPIVKSGNCGKAINLPNHLGKKSTQHCYQTSTFVGKPKLDYDQYIQKKKAPLTGVKSHYPPMVSNRACGYSSTFTYQDFIARLTCK
jgi:hypothetical protein